MTKKLTLLAIAFLAVATTAFSQEINPRVEQYKDQDMGKRIIINKWYQNWEVAARIGTQGYMGEYCLDHFRFVDWFVFPAVDASISKWGTQSIGLALNFTYSPFKSLYLNTPGSTEPKYATFATPDDEVYKYDNNFNIARGHMGNAYISVIFDCCNLFGGYKPERKYHLIASIGGGMMFPLSQTQYRDICASFNAGLINKWYVGKHMSIDLAIRGTLHDDMFNGVSYYNSDDHRNLSVDATIGVTAGVAYRFDFPRSVRKANEKKRANTEGWTTVDEIVPYTSAYKELEKELAAANAMILAYEEATAPSETTVAPENNAALMPVAVATKEKEPFSYRQLVNFRIDKWYITNREKVAILLAAEVIKEHPNIKFKVQGFADMQTSYPAHNQFLSENRVNGVYNVLVNEFGVNPDQLIKSAHGGVDYMFFNDPQCSRSVMIIAVPEE